MSFASLRVFTYAYPVSFLSKCHAKSRKEVLAVRTSYRKEVLALLSCSRKEVLPVSRTQAQATSNQPQEELLLADAKRSSCACIIFGLYSRSTSRPWYTQFFWLPSEQCSWCCKFVSNQSCSTFRHFTCMASWLFCITWCSFTTCLCTKGKLIMSNASKKNPLCICPDHILSSADKQQPC